MRFEFLRYELLFIHRGLVADWRAALFRNREDRSTAVEVTRIASW